MKWPIFCVISMLGSSQLLAAEQSPACLAKRAGIENRISEAETRGNFREVRGLKRALRANSEHCTTASLEAERNREIAEATEKVAERHAELENVERKGNVRKIAGQRAKLEEARRDLAEAERPMPQ